MVETDVHQDLCADQKIITLPKIIVIDKNGH